MPTSKPIVREVVPNLFWTDDGWCADLREYRIYPDYGEGDWTLRADNAGLGCREVVR